MTSGLRRIAFSMASARVPGATAWADGMARRDKDRQTESFVALNIVVSLFGCVGSVGRARKRRLGIPLRPGALTNADGFYGPRTLPVAQYLHFQARRRPDMQLRNKIFTIDGCGGAKLNFFAAMPLNARCLRDPRRPYDRLMSTVPTRAAADISCVFFLPPGHASASRGLVGAGRRRALPRS